jgi:hypothetical protein
MEKSVSLQCRVRRCSGESADGVERELAAWTKAEPLIERDGGGVLGGDVEVRANTRIVVMAQQISK